MANKNKKKIESFEQLANAQQHKRPAASQEEPAISTMLDEFEMWMAVNWKKAIIGVCAFAVLVSVIIIIQGAIQRAELEARRELANAGSIAELEAAIAKHPGNKAADFARPGNKAADFARLRLAGELITANQPGDMEKAREQLLAVASSSKSETFIKIRSALDAAYILEQLGKKEDAATEFERIAGLSQTPRDLGVEAAYSAARIFSGLDQMMKADAALKKINFTAAAADASAVYGYWASLAKQLDEQIHPQAAASVSAPAEKPAEAKPADAPAAAAETPAA